MQRKLQISKISQTHAVLALKQNYNYVNNCKSQGEKIKMFSITETARKKSLKQQKLCVKISRSRHNKQKLNNFIA